MRVSLTSSNIVLISLSTAIMNFTDLAGGFTAGAGAGAGVEVERLAEGDGAAAR